jgi:cell division protein FtsQ
MKSKSRNQRISSSRLRKQQHLLEVTVRADKARVMRNRAIAAFICRATIVVILGVGGWLGGKELLRRFVWENPDYLLSEVDVKTDGALQRDQVLQAANIREGVNIFTVDTKAARLALDKLPQVERAEIKRELPNKIEINIIERRPIAWVTERAGENPTANEKAWLIDARGVVMKSKRMLEEYYHLPQISGVAVENLTAGQRVNTVEMQSALELIRLNAPNTRWQARNVDLTKGYCMVVTDQNHTKVTFGLDGVELQLDRLFRYLDRADEEKKEIQTVNLLVRKNTPVTFHEPAPEEGSSTPPPPIAAPGEPQSPKPIEKPKETPVVKPATPVARAIPVASPKGTSAKSTKVSSSSKKTEKTEKPAKPSTYKPFRP